MADAMTSMLERFGIDYPNAPKPTPALLAFMRGLGMSLDTAQDSQRTNEQRMRERATLAREGLDRTNERATTNMTSDLQTRNVLSSGETNTRVARRAEDHAYSVGQVEQSLAEGLDENDQNLARTRDSLSQGALEKVLGVETQQATQKAALEAEERQWTRQTDATETQYKREKKARDDAYAATEALYKKYGGL